MPAYTPPGTTGVSNDGTLPLNRARNQKKIGLALQKIGVSRGLLGEIGLAAPNAACLISPKKPRPPIFLGSPDLGENYLHNCPDFLIGLTRFLMAWPYFGGLAQFFGKITPSGGKGSKR